MPSAGLGRRPGDRRSSRARVLVAVAAMLASVPAVTSAPDAARAAAAVDVGAIALEAGTPWVGRQRPNGSFVDYMPSRRGGDRYGTAMMGLALLDQGLRVGSDAHVSAALDAIRFAARRAYRFARHSHRNGRRTVFENFALATAYNLARGRLAGDPRFESVAPLWRRTLRAMGRRVLGNHGYYNFKLVQAAAILELLRSGLRSHRRDAVLASRRLAKRYVRNLINHIVPKVARYYDRGRGHRRTTLISDPPWNPPAYQAFSLMMIARCLSLMDASTTGPPSASARAAFLASLRGSADLMGPDGDVSYWGRSQQQSWTLAGTAYAAAAALRFADSELAATADAMAARALARLRERYARPGLGFVMTPAFASSGERLPIRGVDTYAGGSSYAALTLVALEWLTREAPIEGDPNGNIPADVGGIRFVGRGQSTTAVVRVGTRWFAVGRAPARTAGKNSLYARDLRYDAGLLAFKLPDPSGRWHDVMPQRPRTSIPDSVGPTIRRHQRLWRPVGQRVGATARGTITIDGELRDFRGHPARRRFRIIVAPEACGVRTSFGVHARERTQYSLFFRRPPTIRRGRRLTLSDDSQVVYVSPMPKAVTVKGGYSSGADGALVRARLIFKAAVTRRVSVTICPRGMLIG